MGIDKSTRHQRIIGKFGEWLVCNWLSRSGFEVVLVDHTGIDIIAYKSAKLRLGITVKSRTRKTGTEGDSVNVLSYRTQKDDREKLKDACRAFACRPWIAVYVESSESADLYLSSLKHYDDKYRRKGKAVDVWRMTKEDRRRYEMDPHVRHVQINFASTNWWSSCKQASGG